jgi:segregation and condensation protein B
LELKELEGAIEGILFAAGDPVPVDRICFVLEQDKETVESVCQRLADQYSYERRGTRLVKLENSWQMCSAPEYADYIRKTLESRKPAKLSQPALEVLSIIAYFQPVTRAYIEQVRGVDCSAVMQGLQQKGLIEERGRMDLPGRPLLYGTTPNFLRCFGISSLEQLPPLPQKQENAMDETTMDEILKQEEPLPEDAELFGSEEEAEA